MEALASPEAAFDLSQATYAFGLTLAAGRPSAGSADDVDVVPFGASSALVGVAVTAPGWWPRWQ
ncbi:hypothetical protein B7767_19755 [Streptomyces sp. 13-12-16]|nr:hypothetical protein B7767_19755 [Streptomyces sp. 13-12-16]